MRVLLVDDESSARRRLCRLLSAYPDVDIAGEAEDGIDALASIESLRPDVVFLDIQMPELDGFDVIRAIPQTIDIPLIIFATSYDDYALAAFEANAIAYLLKPIDAERLSSAIERVRRLLASVNEREREGRRIVDVSTAAKRLQRIVCRKGSRFILINPSEVLWFYIEDGIVRAKTALDTFWVNYQLNQLEAELDPDVFFRSRRDVLLNLTRVKSIKSYERSTFMLTMADVGETELLVSERQAKELRHRLPGL